MIKRVFSVFNKHSFQMGKFVFGEPVMIVGADVTHWAKGKAD